MIQNFDLAKQYFNKINLDTFINSCKLYRSQLYEFAENNEKTAVVLLLALIYLVAIAITSFHHMMSKYRKKNKKTGNGCNCRYCYTCSYNEIAARSIAELKKI